MRGIGKVQLSSTLGDKITRLVKWKGPALAGPCHRV